MCKYNHAKTPETSIFLFFYISKYSSLKSSRTLFWVRGNLIEPNNTYVHQWELVYIDSRWFLLGFPSSPLRHFWLESLMSRFFFVFFLFLENTGFCYTGFCYIGFVTPSYWSCVFFVVELRLRDPGFHNAVPIRSNRRAWPRFFPVSKDSPDAFFFLPPFTNLY